MGLFCDPHGYELRASDQANAQCRTGQTREGLEQVVVDYPTLEGGENRLPIHLQYVISAQSDGSILIQCQLTNSSPYVIEEVFVPLLSGILPFGKWPEAELVYPCKRTSLGNLLPVREGGNWELAPLVSTARDQQIAPGWPNMYELSMPWVDLSNGGEGLFMASKDCSGVRHNLVMRDVSRSEHGGLLDIGWGFVPDIAPHEVWESPEIVVTVHDGDWHDAADKYRALVAPWYSSSVPQRSKFWQMAASFNTCITDRDYSQIARLAHDISGYGVRDLITWYFGNYYPVLADSDNLSVSPPKLGQFTSAYGGEQALRQAIKEAGGFNVAVGTIVSQRLWNFDTLDGELRDNAERWVMRTQTGHPVTEHWNHKHYGATQWYGQATAELYVMCTASPAWQRMSLNNIAQLLQRSGYRTLFYDQSTEGNLCYASDHFHPSPSAAQQATSTFLQHLGEVVRYESEDGSLIGEGVEVISSQYTDVNWCWVDRGWQWNRSDRFPNPEIFRYCLPWVRIAFSADCGDIASLNQMFVMGIHLGLVPGSLESGRSLSAYGSSDNIRQFQQLLEGIRERVGGLETAIYVDDVGIVGSHGVFVRGYRFSNHLVLLVGNLTQEHLDFNVEIDSKHYSLGSTNMWHQLSKDNDVELQSQRVGNYAELSASADPYEVLAVYTQLI